MRSWIDRHTCITFRHCVARNVLWKDSNAIVTCRHVNLMDRQRYKGLKHIGSGKVYWELYQDLTIISVSVQQGENFRTRPDRPWGPLSLLYNGYQVLPGGVKRPVRGVDHPPPSSAKVKERLVLYLYSPYGTSWPNLGWTLPSVQH